MPVARYQPALFAALALVGLLAVPAEAEARSSRQVSYPVQRVWPAAVRFLRIDERLKIVEKDAEAGYVIFELAEDRKTFEGALEVVATKDTRGREATKVIVRIGDRPAYVEDGLLERFERRLREDLGEPVAPPAPPAPAPDRGGEKKPKK